MAAVVALADVHPRVLQFDESATLSMALLLDATQQPAYGAAEHSLRLDRTLSARTDVGSQRHCRCHRGLQRHSLPVVDPTTNRGRYVLPTVRLKDVRRRQAPAQIDALLMPWSLRDDRRGGPKGQETTRFAATSRRVSDGT